MIEQNYLYPAQPVFFLITFIKKVSVAAETFFLSDKLSQQIIN